MNTYLDELESLRNNLIEKQARYINKVVSTIIDDFWFSETAKRQELQQIS